MEANTVPLVSVIIAVRNGQATLDRCLRSIASQTYANREVIIIDGGSTDGTVSIIEHSEGLVTYWLSEPDKGIADAWNKGLAAARGAWICFLGADDYFWSPDSLAKAVEFLMLVDDRTLVAYGSVALVSREETVLGVYGEEWERAGPRFRQIVSFPHQGTFHRRSLFEKRGTFDLEFRIGPDYELLLRELKDNRAAFIPGLVIAGMGYGGLTSSPENALLGLLDIRRAQKKNGIAWPGLIWLGSIIKAIGRIALFRLFGRRFGGMLVDFGRLATGKKRFWTKIPR